MKITHGYVGRYLVTAYEASGRDLSSYYVHGDKSYIGSVRQWTSIIWIKYVKKLHHII